MAEKRKNGLVRQFSVQNDKPKMLTLKKQLSVEQIYTVKETGIDLQSEIRKNILDRPRLVKLAWGDNADSPVKQSLIKNKQITEGVEIKKCTEHKRPTTVKLRTQKSLDRDSILYTRQELAERLRQAWIDREQNKQNLNIFLTHSAQEKQEDDIDSENNLVDHENITNIGSNNDAQIFNKTKNDNNENNKNSSKPKRHILVRSETIDVPTNFIPKQQNININLDVNIPMNKEITNQVIMIENEQSNTELDENKTNFEIPTLMNKSFSNTDNNQNNIHLVNSATGMSRREAFQKRTNSAFNGSLCIEKNNKPPLTRTLSIPIKSDVPKPLFIATKRKLKTIKKRDRESCELIDEELPHQKPQSNKKEVRCKSAPGGDIVTMVSLVSPAGSDVEDIIEKSDNKTTLQTEKLTKDKNSEQVKTIVLRKTIKQVSFQQSSIHAIRSFSASFPSRSNLVTATSNKSHQIGDREKRAPFESVDIRDAKRRHLISKKTIITNCFKNMEKNDNYNDNSNSVTENVPNILEQTVQNDICVDINSTDIISGCNESDMNNDEIRKSPEDSDTPNFESTKERECWAMYKKMSAKGLPVTYDTLLRGMLTPTEYRLIKKEVTATSQ